MTETQGWLLIAGVLLVHLDGWPQQLGAVLYLLALLWAVAERGREERRDCPPG